MAGPYYVGPGGNDGNNGTSWALRKLTLNGAEDIPVVPGDVVWVGPGVYREKLTADVSGGSVYQVGTVSVTKGSKQVTGNGTAWLANVAADYMFRIVTYASGNDGVANGTATFTSAGGNFQASMIGKIIGISAKGAYRIDAVAAANSITLADVAGLGWPGAGGGLTYSVTSGEGPYDVDSVDDNATIQLKQPWNGPTLTGISYTTFNPIRYIGDVTGEHTDEVGGIVRITGSDDDQSSARNYIIYASGKDYRVFRGFLLDSGDYYSIFLTNGCDSWVFEDCAVWPSFQTGALFRLDVAPTNMIIRRSILISHGAYALDVRSNVAEDDTGNIFENLIVLGGAVNNGFYILRTGDCVVKNILTRGFYRGVYALLANVGHPCVVNNSIIQGNSTGLASGAAGQLIEDFNNLRNLTNRSGVAIGGSSVSYPVLLQPPVLHAGADLISGFKFSWLFGALSEWSQMRALTGSDEPSTDLFGITRPVTVAKNSWGPVQFQDTERETGTVHAGSVSMCLHDAGRHQIFVPVTNEETTISIYVYREANYTGNLPQMILKQPGQVDRVTTDGGAAGGWNLLTDTFTPVADPPYVVVELVSRNTAGAGNYETFFDDLVVS